MGRKILFENFERIKFQYTSDCKEVAASLSMGRKILFEFLETIKF
jgi:hypothetical protein